MAKNKTDSEELNKNTFHDFYILARDRISQLQKKRRMFCYEFIANTSVLTFQVAKQSMIILEVFT